MRCRRIRHELLWLARFGEFGPSSQPHLDHLAGCRACRDEVGFDRAMVEQLRIALAARIEDANPPATAWDRILARAQRPEPAPAVRFWEWSTALVGRLRFATTMAGTGLALVLALNMEIVAVGVPAADAPAVPEPVVLQQVPRIPFAQSSLARLTQQWGGGASSAQRPDPEAQLTVVARAPISAGDEPVAEDPEEAATQVRLVVRPMQTPDPGPSTVASAAPGTEPQVERVRSEAGEPS